MAGKGSKSYNRRETLIRLGREGGREGRKGSQWQAFMIIMVSYFIKWHNVFQNSKYGTSLKISCIVKESIVFFQLGKTCPYVGHGHHLYSYVRKQPSRASVFCPLLPHSGTRWLCVALGYNTFIVYFLLLASIYRRS